MSTGRNEARIMEKEEEGEDKGRREKVWIIMMQSGGGRNGQIKRKHRGQQLGVMTKSAGRKEEE